jgi:hypothetical protein
MEPFEPKGVAYTEPPPHLLEDALRIVTLGVEQLPPGAHGAIVAVATETGANGAIVARVNEHFELVGWVGKSWGSTITYGGAAKVVW